ncbi:hypothetical protein [Phytohabitans aurantiacus]|uniref:hypothetical protein n=1 Tax=Phytohabitans aurantiacus TaxID=3016789 RepID=UPI00248FBC5D|nr:hypothetical protein [Phytohabitans aurantiacus]
MPRRRLQVDISGLVDLQYGVVRRDQIVGATLTDGSLRWLLRSRQWQVVLPSVYASFTGRLTDAQREVAAQLYCGPSSQLTGPAALRAHGMRYAPDDELLHMLVPHTCHVSSSGFVLVRRTRRLDGRPVQRGAVTLASVARAVADTARACVDLRSVRAMVAEAVQRRLTTVALLREELDSGARKGSALMREALGEVASGVRSAPEAQLRQITETSSALPAVLWNPALVTLSGLPLPTPDGWIDDVGIALEVDSREHHSMPDDWSKTLHRHNILTSHGALVLHFTPTAIYAAPETVRRTIVESYLERVRSGGKAAIRLRSPSP